MTANAHCPECGRKCRVYLKPFRLECEKHGVISQEDALRPDPADYTDTGPSKVYDESRVRGGRARRGKRTS